ncbi:hypothetical protein KFK09_023677 [Dendrobium nobile]|uniref:Retrotransposon gag domain-containing protein n=1 Tax=Dendrobium nobile TaxID=94219 RepID=A0A8T3ABQ5_DENNO|nr:hypothetical protein KFK09_023677 [Dendrobium nobile]
MAGKTVDILEGEVGQLKADLEERFFNLQNQITSNNERLEGKFTAMEEMLKKLLEMKTNPATSEVRETADGHDMGGNPNPLRGRRNVEVEILEEENDRPPLEPLSREEMSMGYDRREGDFGGRREGSHRRGAEFERIQRRGGDFEGRREERHRRGAEFEGIQRRGDEVEGRRGEYEEGLEYIRRRDDRDNWGTLPLRGMGGYGGYPGDPKVRKLKMPVFEGEDGHGWIYKVERYFAVNGLTEDEKLTAAGLCLEGKALAWYQWRDKRKPIRNWREFKNCIIERFQTDRGGDFYEQFFALVQEGSVEDYCDRFEHLASRVERLSDSVLEGNFMKGLKAEIRAAVKVLMPSDLEEAMKLAQLVENQNNLEKGARSSSSGGSYKTTTTLLAQKGPASVNNNEITREKPIGGGSGDNFKKLTETELQEKRAKGLCFRCDERYTPGHRCKDRTLQVLIVCDEEGMEGVVFPPCGQGGSLGGEYC